MKKVTKLASLLFIATFALYSCINDANVAALDMTDPDQEGNLALVCEIPNVSETRNAESSGATDTGSESEYKVNKLTIYLFDATTKAFVEQKELTNFTYAAPNGSSIRYNTKKITVKPGFYNIFAIANGKIAATDFSTQDKFLASVDKSTYSQGKISNVPESGFMMSNRGAANLNVVVDEPTKSKTTNISISLERVVAKIELTQLKESFQLLDDDGKPYCTIKLNNFRIMNLATEFYTFRHTAVLNDFQEPSSYTSANFGNISDNNCYVIDPYFFKKSPNEDDAKNFTNADGFFADALVEIDKDDKKWTGMNTPGNWSYIYCLENCMFSTAQKNAYTTGVMFKATVDIATDHVFDEKGQVVNNPNNWPTRLYFCGKKFYTSIDAIKFKYEIPDYITSGSSAEELAKVHIKYFDKTANYSCYYNYWIKHLDNNSPEMGVMEFGIVRNNVYKLSVSKISDIGTGEPPIKPEQPDENDAVLEIDFSVFPWVIRDQNVEL